MQKPRNTRDKIEAPHVLRPGGTSFELRARRLIDTAERLGQNMPPRARMAGRPIVLGAIAALSFGFVVDVGPWSTIAGKLLGTAGAQESTRSAFIDGSTPSEADRAALRYLARQGDVERLEAELRRLRALYPSWNPPRDLLDSQGEDTELQEFYRLVGEQRYGEAREAIALRQQRDPTYQPPARLIALLELAETREALREASDARNFAEVLRIAQANEGILTCEDVDSLWRVAEAFAFTARPQRAFDAYAYVITTCEDENLRAGSIQKAAEVLDAVYVIRLFELNEAEFGVGVFGDAQLGIIRAAVAAAGETEGVTVPQEYVDLLADFARTGENLEDAMLVGYYLFRVGFPQEAAQWFRFALDNGLGADAAEGYIIALRATGNREDAFLAREVAYQWREQTPELMEAYLDSVASLLTADEFGELSVEDVQQAEVDRFVPVAIGQRDAIGAQALGWYAFNTCQFIIAEEWFISSANWVPTEAALYGLALTRLRLGDQAGFDEIVDEWGPLYASVRGLRLGESFEPANPVGAPEAGAAGGEIGIESVVCDPEERARLRELLVEQRRGVTFTEAGSLTAGAVPVNALAQRPDGMQRPNIPRRSVVIRPNPQTAPKNLLTQVQAQVPSLSGPGGAIDGSVRPQLQSERPSVVLPPQPGAPVGTRPANTFVDPAPRTTRRRLSPEEARPITRSQTVVTGGNRTVSRGGSNVTRRVRQGRPLSGVDRRVESIVSGTSTRSSVGGSAGGSSAQQALAGRNFSRCVAVTNRGIASGNLSAADATARGFCLLELRRPVEAAQAFQLASLARRANSSTRNDAVYGSTLAAIAANQTSRAAIEATKAPLSRGRRTELQIAILTQRAIAANRDGRYTEAIYFLDQRDRIAPLQKDLMLLRGYAYLNAGDLKNAERIFRAVGRSGGNGDTAAALNVVRERRVPPSFREGVGEGLGAR